ncbi:hypothetical protein ANANG_G00230860 [Anguilla anguilla]|uniref:SERTA domain-containing protein n=1 Tax=Anguilla anguilla TaxID=7936 RepID=A0A9D3RN14_ANGAN|nr:hypothetical protein ANANG_G00230860 [Anguilla anguilla]
MGKGQKRKLPEAPEGGSAERGSVVYELQRQSVLDLSLDKFQRCQTLAEPRLLHSVLITNTLRHIQEEIRQEAPPPAPPRGTPEPHPQGEAPPTRPPASSRPVGLEDAGEDWMALSSEEDFSLSSAVCSILKDLDTVIDGGLAVPRPPLGSIENLPGRRGPGGRRGRATEGGAVQRGLPSTGGRRLRSLEVMRSSYLRDVALDDLFLDIDTSAYERDAAPLGARTLSGAAGDELLKFLPALASSAASPFPHSPSARDLNDLEHIMEILVGS